jgi:uncharacterized coiled-coil protein SlyX
MDEQRVNPFCSSHVHNEQSIAELRGIVLKLTEGMAQVRESMVQLTEAFKNLERVDKRLDRLEELHRVDSGKQQERLEGLERNVYKAGGIIAGILLILEVGFKFWGK